MANEALKGYVKNNGFHLWQIADRLGMNDSNFSRYLRKELSPREKEEILKIVADLRRGE